MPLPRLLVLAASLSLLPCSPSATELFFYDYSDLLLGIRQVGDPEEVIINLGHASQFYSAPAGQPFRVTAFEPDQLAGLFESWDGLRWSVSGGLYYFDDGDLSVPEGTIWITRMRTDPNVPSDPWIRQSLESQLSLIWLINNVGIYASAYSSLKQPGDYDSPELVSIPSGLDHFSYSYWIGPEKEADFGEFQGNVETVTPPNFVELGEPVRADLYELRPDLAAPFDSPATPLGIFEFRPDGTLWFTASTREILVTTTNSYSNPAPIAILDHQPAHPYPSTIQVTDAPKENVSKISVTLHGLSHHFITDVAVLLQGPGNQKVVLMSQAGSILADQNSVTNLTLTFDPEASQSINNYESLQSGVYRPSHFAKDLIFPQLDSAYEAGLEVFRDMGNPNGLWSLYVLDTQNPDAGQIQGGWTLSIQTTNMVPLATAPLISGIPDLTLPEDTVSDPILFSIVDEIFSSQDLLVSVHSSDPWLVSEEDFKLERIGEDWSLTLTPRTNQYGAATITIYAENPAGEIAQSSFDLTVASVNDPPSISPVLNQASTPGQPTDFIPFVIEDLESDAQELFVTGDSSNPNMVSKGSLVFQGSGSIRQVKVYPTSATTRGESIITLRVFDPDGGTSETTFQMAFDIEPGDPILPPFSDLSIPESLPISTDFMVGDAFTPVDQLQITASSSDPNALPDSHISISGKGPIRTLHLTPLGKWSGQVTITVTLRNPITQSETSRSFLLAVAAPIFKPSLVIQPEIIFDEDSDSGEIAILLENADSLGGAEMVMGWENLTDPNLISQILFDGAGIHRTVKLIPAANAFGKSRLTVTASDAKGNGTTADVNIYIKAVNDPPSFQVPSSPPLFQEDDEKATLMIDGISPGNIHEGGQLLTITAVSGNPEMVSRIEVDYEQGQSTATLKFSLVENANGEEVPITVAVKDNGGTARKGADTRARSFKVNILPVNDPPEMEDIPDQIVFKNQIQQVPFHISDVDHSGLDLTVVPQIVSDPDKTIQRLQVTAGGNPHWLAIIPNDHSYTVTQPAVIRVTVTDKEGATDSDDFSYTVSRTALNTPPVIEVIRASGTPLNGTLKMPEDSLSKLELWMQDDQDPSRLALSATSDNPALFPNDNLRVEAGADPRQRYLWLVPKPNLSGTARILLKLKDHDQVSPLESTRLLQVTVEDTLDFPMLSGLTDQQLDEDTSVEVEFTVSDEITPLDQLTFEQETSHPHLLPLDGIEIIGMGARRKLKLTPAADQFGGPVTVTLRAVNRSGLKAAMAFRLMVNPVDDPPTITPVADVVIQEDSGPQTILLSGLAGGPSNEPGEITFEPVRTDPPEVIPAAEARITDYNPQNGTARLVFSPAANRHGNVQLSVVMADAALNRSTNYIKVAVTEVNDPPVISYPAGNSGFPTHRLPNPPPVQEGQVIFTDAFSVEDSESPPQDLIMEFVSSSNPALVDGNGISFGGGQGLTRGIIIRPKPYAHGTAALTVRVKDTGNRSDGSEVKSWEASFQITVHSVEDPPRLSAIEDVRTEMNVESPIIAFSMSDPESPADQLTVAAAPMSNPGLIARILFDPLATGETRRMIIIPATNLLGEANIQVTATDPSHRTAVRSFQFRVVHPDLPPAITTIPDQVIAPDASTGLLSFTVTDPGQPSGFLKVEGTSSNPSLIPDANIQLLGSGGHRQVQVRPLAGQQGVALITLTVTDLDHYSAQTAFRVTVLGATPLLDSPANLPPPNGESAMDTPSLSMPAASPTGLSDDFLAGRASPKINDFNGDQQADLFFQHADGTMAVWLLNGIDLIISQILEPNENREGCLVANGDMNRDGKMDLLFQQPDGRLAIQYLRIITQTETEILPGVAVAAGWRLAATGEFNGDEQLDLVFQHADGAIEVWLMNGPILARKMPTSPTGPIGSDWRLAGAADFNQDRQTDLLFQHQTSGDLAVWLMHGTTQQEGRLLHPSNPGNPAWKLVAVADYNDDGQIDLVFQNGRDLGIWFMNGIKLVGGKFFPERIDDPAWSVAGPR